MLLGSEALQNLAKAKVAVIGLGGVGSYATEMLVRSGVGHLKLVDCDRVAPSNLNRQLQALHSTLGRWKAEVLAERAKDINPEVVVEPINTFMARENRLELLRDCDYIVDAVDSLGPKTGLIEDAINNNWRIISVMGAAGRVDPACISIGDLSMVHGCPLAARVRRYLHRRGWQKGHLCVWSSEQPVKPVPVEQTGADNTVERGRPRGLQASWSCIPAIMGIWAASHVLRELGRQR